MQIDYKSGSSKFFPSYRRIVPSKFLYLTIKRFIDIILSLAAVVLFLPFAPFIILVIKLDSPGPIFFKQERLGKYGKPFTIYKFRTMHCDAEKGGAQWAQKNDPRITRVGKVYRLLRIDEIPQLINIIKGEMSIVGPRPEREVFYTIFSEYIPHFKDRLAVTPGLTGWAQVNGGYDLKPEEKIQYDLFYIMNCNTRLDIKCIMKTFRIILLGDGAR